MSKLIFREYIGVKPSPTGLVDFPTTIIDSKNFEFHYILGFASEGYGEHAKGDGIFSETWNVDFFGPEKVKNLKKTYSDIKVVISIGGRDDKTPFNPSEKNIWIKNAGDSLKVIIKKYNNDSGENIIDGIDINYETIKNDDLFVQCISQVIKDLKSDSDLHIDVVSIALSEKNKSHYRKLYYDNPNSINWVGYQFYNQEKAVSKVEEFVEIYTGLTKDYGSKKVLPGFSTDPVDTARGKITRENFIDGCLTLKRSSKLPGVLLWNANDSAIPPPGQHTPYLVELNLQGSLTKPTKELPAISSQ